MVSQYISKLLFHFLISNEWIFFSPSRRRLFQENDRCQNYTFSLHQNNPGGPSPCTWESILVLRGILWSFRIGLIFQWCFLMFFWSFSRSPLSLMRDKLYWYQVLNEQPTRGLVQSWTKWISLGGFSTVNTHPGPPSFHQPLLGFCLHDSDLGSKNSESSFIPLLFRSGCQYSPAVVLLQINALGTFIYLSWVFITFLFWSQERSCPFCPCRNKVCSVSSGGSSPEQTCFTDELTFLCPATQI